jgi:hypothetical protein
MRFPEAIRIMAQGRRIKASRIHFMDFRSVPKWIWEGRGKLKTADGQVWDGTGVVIGVSGGSYQAGATAANMELSLAAKKDDLSDDLIASGVNSESEVYGRRYLQGIQLFTKKNKPVDQFFVSFLGFMDYVKFAHDKTKRSLTLNVESAFVRKRAARVRYFSDADQKSWRDPNDKFFEWISGLKDKNFPWPKAD